jgi:putative solute:sodium symporter small subunit
MSTETTPTPPPPSSPADRHAREQAILKRYWQSNIRIMGILLAIWAFVGLGCGIWFADILAPFMLPGTGYPLGFWFAQQGAIVTFVLLILVYAILMNRLDRKHHEEREEL